MSEPYVPDPTDLDGLDGPSEAEQEAQRLKWRDRLSRGDAFVLDAPAYPESVCGNGHDVIWSRGEPLILSGNIGAGKTTISGLLVRARLGLVDNFLGYKVLPGQRNLVYLACDRPRQIRRNLRRQFSEADRDVLHERMYVWEGPPTRDVAKEPEILARLAWIADADTLIVDALKDIAVGLTDDTVGASIQRALQLCVAAGVEVMVNHHQRKGSRNGTSGKPKTLEDLYGSTWIGAGAGTVMLAWVEQPGSGFVQLSTLKPAAESVGPLALVHDFDSGRLTVQGEAGVESLLRGIAPARLTIADMLTRIGRESTAAERERVRRQLERCAKDGTVEMTTQVRIDGGQGPSEYRWTG